MNADEALRELAFDCGVHLEFQDMAGVRKAAEPPTLRALLGGLGIPASSEAAVAEVLEERRAARKARHLPHEIILPAGAAVEIAVPAHCDWSLATESGEEVRAGASDHAISLSGLPVGYFTLHAAFSGGRKEEAFVLCPPQRAPVLAERTGSERSWGICGALYGLRSQANGGLGNYSDLAVAAGALGRSGAQFFGINPIHALGWAATDTISPYSPTHRGFFNTDHISAEADLGPGPKGDQIDYADFRSRHRPALEAEFAGFGNQGSQKDRAAFERYCKAAGQPLNDFATFEALSELHGEAFGNWPADLQCPGKAAEQAAGARAGFHRWLQWRAEQQIVRAQHGARSSGMKLGLYLDLAVGPRRNGAEVWMNRDTIAGGISIGAPPDHLSPEGQSWNLAAHAPNKLAANRYEPLRTMLGKLMAKCGLLRIDHALGLLRSYWLPDDGGPGAYISQPFNALLAVITIEAWRSGCVVVGEDLGLVPEGFREGLNSAGLYSYAVWQYETDESGWLIPPEQLRPFSLACFGTHDTPTLAGFWYGLDIEWWRRIGWLSEGQAENRHGMRAHQRNSLRSHCGLGHETDIRRIGAAIHASLARSPAALTAVQLDDLFGVTEAQNLPGTIDQHPNWRRRLPVAIEQFPAAGSLARLRDLMPGENNSTHPTEQKGLEPCPQ